MIMWIQYLVLIGLFVFKILSKKLILTSIKAVTLLQICRNSNSSKLSCMSSIPARMKKIQLKMKALECSQDFSHYKSMGIFPDAQGQLTPQSLVRSGRISNSSEMLWMSSLPASMKKIRSITPITLVLVSISGRNNNVFKKFGLNRSIRFQDIELKLNSDVNQGP